MVTNICCLLTVYLQEPNVERYVVPGETIQVPEPIQVQSFTQVMENQVRVPPVVFARGVSVPVPHDLFCVRACL